MERIRPGVNKFPISNYSVAANLTYFCAHMIPRETINRIIETAVIEEVVGEFISLKRSGRNFKALSPFTNEKTPSFYVVPHKNIFKDFSSGKGGSAVTFLMEHEKMSYPEALRWLAKKYNIEIEDAEPTADEQANADHRESLFIINNFARDYFQHQLLHHQDGRTVGLAYFKERGFREDIINKFQLGYSLDAPNDLTAEAKRRGYKPEYLKELGLTRDRNNQELDFFRGRVMFVIHNLSGKVLGFAGRIMDNTLKTAKYINSPESLIYHKSDVLYGLYHAKNTIRNEDECLLVEGYTDVLSLHQGGIENVVASSGTALTEGQVRLIKRYSQNVTILFDGDKAGISAALRGLDIVIEAGLTVRLVSLPDGEDPDSYIRKVGSAAFKEYITTHSKDFIFFKTDTLLRQAKDDPASRAGVIKSIVESIAKVPDTIQRSLYVQECARLMDLSERILVNEVNKQLRELLKRKSRLTPTESDDLTNVITEETSVRSETTTHTDQLAVLEKDLTRLLLEYGDKQWENDATVAEWLLYELADEPFHTKIYRLIFDAYRLALQEGSEPPSTTFFLNHMDANISNIATDLLTEPYELSVNWEKKHEIYVQPRTEYYKKDLESAFLRYRLYKISEAINVNRISLKNSPGPDNMLTLLEERKYLLKIKMDTADRLNTVIMSDQ